MAALVVGIAACSGNTDSAEPTPVPSPLSATFSITSSPRQVPPATDTDRHNALLMAYNAGARGQYISVRWSEIEPVPGVYALQGLTDTLSFLRSQGTFQVYL